MFRVFLAVLALVAAGAADAAPRAKKPRAPSSIELINQRALPLETFALATMEAPDKPLAKISKPLAPGAKIRLRVVRAKGCLFVARWKFEDAGDEAEVDLCNDPKIVLTD